LYFFASVGKGKAAEETRIVVVSHGLVKEQAVPEVEIDRAIERKRRFEASAALGKRVEIRFVPIRKPARAGNSGAKRKAG
jgi:hypothetical protein